MAKKEEVIVKLTLEDGSTINVTQKKLDALRASMKKLDEKQKAVKTSSNAVKREFEGVSERANNAGKDFARMSQGMGGLVQAYATVAANVFALSTAFNLLSQATNFQDMISSARNLSAEFGTSFILTANAIKEATKAQIDFKTSLRAANKASAAGISADKVAKFAAAAAKSAQTFGGTTTDALNRMVTAILQGETELLKEVGIVISSNEAFLQYGITIGKAANELTSFEKRQALANAVLTESERLFAGTTIQVNNFEVLAAKLADNVQKVFKIINNNLGVSAVVGKIAESWELQAAGVGLFVKSILTKLTPSLDIAVKIAKDRAKTSLALSKAASKEKLEIIKAEGLGEKAARRKAIRDQLDLEKKALAERLALLKKEGRLKAEAFRKGSTLRKALEGEDFSQRGVTALQRNNTALATRRKTKDDPGFNKAARDETVAGLKRVIEEEKKLVAADKELAASQKKVASQMKTNITSIRASIAATRSNVAATKEAILTANQGAVGFQFWNRTIGATKDVLRKMEAEAKKTGTTVSFLQKSVVRATGAMSLFGQAMSKAFGFLITVTIAWGAIQFALEALGIELFKTSKAEKAIEEATTKMSEAFEESKLTLVGMIESIEKLQSLDPDTIFSRTSISLGNFLQEAARNANIGIQALTKQITAERLAQKELELAKAEFEKVRNENRGSRESSFLVEFSVVGEEDILTGAELVAKKAVDEAEKKLKDSKVSPEKLKALSDQIRRSFTALITEVDNSSIDFNLVDELKNSPEVIKLLGDELHNLSSPISIVNRLMEKAGNNIEGVGVAAGAVKKIGERFSAAGNASKELSAQLVLFEGAATRINKQVFKDEGLANYALLIETAGKTIATFKENATDGLVKLSKSLGVSLDKTRAFVKKFQDTIQDAGNNTLDRETVNSILENEKKRLGIARGVNTVFSEKLDMLKEEENIQLRILANDRKNLSARQQLIELAIQGNRKVKQDIEVKDQQILAAGENKELVEKLSLERKALVVKLNNRRLLERDLADIKEQILLLDQIIAKSEKRLDSAALLAKEQGSIRQNLREQANQLLQVLSWEQKVAKAGGEVAEANALQLEIEDQRLFRKKQDLDFDHKALNAQLKLKLINESKYLREVEILKLRAQSIALAEREFLINSKLNEGKRLFQDKGAESFGDERVAITNEQLFNAIMIEGARKLKEELAKSNPLQIASDAAFDSVNNAVDSLVSTIGTGQDDLKGILNALADTMHKAVLEATSSAIKQELLSMFAGEKLKEVREEAQLNSSKARNDLLRQIVKNTAASTVGTGGGTLVAGENGGTAEGFISSLLSSVIPFADGGVVHKPTFSMIGEGKNSEAIVPLPNNREIPVRIEGGSQKTEIVQNFDFSGADAKTEARLRAYVDRNRVGAFSDVFSEINRGGKYAKMSGRR